MRPAKNGDWVPAYRTLMRGTNRAIPRAHRMVFLELCMAARDAGTATVTFRGDLPAGEAVAEDIGGPAAEVEAALATLAAAGKIVVQVGTVLTIHIPSVATHALGDDALRKRNDRGRQSCPPPPGHPVQTTADTVSETPRTPCPEVAGHPVQAGADLEEKRREEIRGEPPLPPRGAEVGGGPQEIPSGGPSLLSMDDLEIQSRLLSSTAFRGVDVAGAARSITAQCAGKGISHARVLHVLPWAISQLEDAQLRPDPPKNPATYVRTLVLKYGPPGAYERRDDGQRTLPPTAIGQTGGKLPVYEASPGLSPDEKRAQAERLREAMQHLGKGGTAA